MSVVRTSLRIAVLGPLRITRGDGQVIDPASLRTAKTRHLLRLLAIEPGGVRSGVLIDQLWPEVTDHRGRGSLRTAASQLRRTLGGHLVRTGDVLALTDVEVDAVLFARDAERAHQRISDRDLAAGLALATSALARYRGDLSEDEPYLDAIVIARERFAMQRTELLLAAGDAAMTLGRVREGVRYGEQALVVDGTCERACRLVMRAYDALGERSMALRVFERCRRAMTDELGIGPGRETRALYVRLLADEPGDAGDGESRPRPLLFRGPGARP